RHRTTTYPELDLALKEFVLIYQHQTVLSDALLIEKAKALADGEAASADEVAIDEMLLLIKDKCANYPIERIYNMDETGLFYRLEPDRTLATQRLSGRKISKERLSIAL
ncbi:2124_t:CDS:2, partial [Dentiscutata erythropus]